MRSAILSAVFACCSVAAVARATQPEAPRPEFPEGTPVPRSLTPQEAAWLKSHPIQTLRGTPEPPSGPIECVAEYEPMEGILMSWEGGVSFTNVLAAMAKWITNDAATLVYMVVDNAAEQSAATTSLSSAGALMTRVKFLIRETDSIWIRDYGPRYIYEGNCRAIIDHIYNRPRPADDVLPVGFAEYKNHARYDLDLIHGGGNYHLDAINRSFCTKLVVNENPSKTQMQIHDLWQSYQAVDTHFFDPFPTSVDATQHLDMWMQVIADNKVVISDWPNNVGSTQDVICDQAALYMAAQGYTVFRTPARSVGGIHYTYTNVVMCNNIVLVPSYTNPSVTAHNEPARLVWAGAMPDKTIIQVNGQPIVGSAGVLHCIVMHIPTARGSGSPTAYLKNLRGGESLMGGDLVEIRWISDDDASVTSVDLQLSNNGGASYPTTIVAGTAPDGSYLWTVPPISTSAARIRAVVYDGESHTGFDQSAANFSITSPLLRGDVNCDGAVNFGDAPVMALRLIDPTAYGMAYPLCDPAAADVNIDGRVDGDDVDALFNVFP